MKLIVATDSRFGIGVVGSPDPVTVGAIPWLDTVYGREDLAYFRSWTHGNDVIMGRATWESLPRRPLPGRRNIVLTSAADTAMPMSAAAGGHSTTSSLTWITSGWIIGGARTYREALATGRVSALYLTYIDHDWACDVHFPIDMLLSLYRTRCINNVAVKYDDCTVYRMVIELEYVAPSPDPIIMPAADEHGYLQLLHEVMTSGESRATRNAVTRSLFARSLTFGLSRFPLLTTKTVFLRGVFEELMMFLRGETDTRRLSAAGVRIWEPNTSAEFLAAAGLQYPPGFMGPMYGYNWRHFGRPYTVGDANAPAAQTNTSACLPTSACSHTAQTNTSGFDQLAACMDLIARDPASRRIIMTTFDPSVASTGVLYPCHGISVQFHVSTGRYLSCAMTQRSADIFLGLPFNIASYALLVYLLCAHLNAKHAWTGAMALRPGRLTINCGDVHLYESHIDAARLQLLRAPGGVAPRLEITTVHDRIEDYVWADVSLTEYTSYGRIAADMIA